MNIRQFLEAERESVLSAREPQAARRLRSRMELIDWLFKGVDDMTPAVFREILADVINGKRHLPKSITAGEANALLQRWLEASRPPMKEGD
jgi:hypothetical protein